MVDRETYYSSWILEGHIKESVGVWCVAVADKGIKGMTRKEWRRIVEGGARCRRLGMCV